MHTLRDLVSPGCGLFVVADVLNLGIPGGCALEGAGGALEGSHWGQGDPHVTPGGAGVQHKYLQLDPIQQPLVALSFILLRSSDKAELEY